MISALILTAVLSPHTYIYKNVGDCAIRADVYRAPGDEIGPAKKSVL
jgi:hypothetical protein